MSRIVLSLEPFKLSRIRSEVVALELERSIRGTRGIVHYTVFIR